MSWKHCSRFPVKSELKRPLTISAKTGFNVDKLVERIIRDIQPPKTPPILFNHEMPKLQTKIQKQREGLIKKAINDTPARAYVFDSWFEPNSGVNLIARIGNGSIQAGSTLFVHSNVETPVEVKSVGVFNPNASLRESLTEGSVGFMATSIKDPVFGIKALGQTLCTYHKGIEPLQCSERQKAIVFASLFPDQPDLYEEFMKAVYKIQMEDPAIEIESESSRALGNGVRAGFLGELHLEVFRQRLLDEFGVLTICTPPSVQYMVKASNGEIFYVRNAADFSDQFVGKVVEYFEMFVKLNIIARSEDMTAIYSIVEARRGKITDVTQISRNQIKLTGEIPLGEIIEDFNKELKVSTRGYGSFDFEPLEYRPAQVTLLKITIMDEEVDAFQFLVHKSKAYDLGKKICQAFAEHIPAQVFTCHIRALIGGRIIAKEEIKATRKDVTAKCYGGDFSRKKKLLERQKEGKARLREIGRVQVSPEAINKIYKSISK